MTFKRPIHTCLVLIGLVFAVACSQQTEKQPESVPAEVESVAQGIVISDAWARPTMTPGQPGGAYLTVVNNSDQDDRMIAVASSRAGRTMMHDNVHVDGVVRMVMMEDVTIPAGGSVAFVPGGAFFADGSGGNTIRLSYSLPKEEVIDQGVARLAAAMRDMIAKI